MLFAVALIAGCGGSNESGDLIAFESDRDGDVEIFVMNADGTEVRQLTDNDHIDWGASWSPDSDRIAFTSDRDGDNEIFVMDADGGKVRQLTDNNVIDWNWSWSPDGDRISFSRRGESEISFGADRAFEIFVMNADGGNVRQLTDNDHIDWGASWSPDGDRLAFTSDRDGNAQIADNFEIFVMNTDGTEIRQLTNNDHQDHFGSWSPDGDRIAFQSDRYGYFEIFVMNADGTDTYSTGQKGWAASFGG